ncbi:hypothetical protein FGRA07_05103 [Fusarium graminearum]|nr:hypothetical protein FGRA07_05103 [Fusarium graminearum]
MRISTFHVLASSLAFNSVAVASVCKPRSSAPIPLSLSTSEALSSTLISASTTVVTYDASTTSGVFIGTTTSEVVVSTDAASSTSEVVVSTDATSSTEISIVESTTSTEPSTETLSTTAVVSDSSITTAEVPTSTSVTTSAATTSQAPPPLFSAIALYHNNEPMTSDRVKGHSLSFPNDEKPEYTTSFFGIDPVSGHLLLDNTLPICAFYGIEDTNPSLGVCPTFISQQVVLITCQIRNDIELVCAAPKVYCSQSGEDVECENLGSEFDSMATVCNQDSYVCAQAFIITATDAISTEATTIAESASTLEIITTETATAAVSTTETDSAETTITSGTISESIDLPTTVEATTAAPSNTAVPLFRITAQSGPTGGQTLLADRNGYSVLLYDNSEGDFSDAFFAVDPVTNYLMLDNKQPICGYFGDNNGLAYWVRCDTSPTIEQAKLTCEIPTSTGEVLECRVPEIICDNDCVPTGETWSFTYTNTWGLGRWSANLGPESQNGGYKTALIVEFLD